MFGVDLIAYARRGIDNAWATTQSFLTGLVVPKHAGTGIKVDTDDPTFGWADMLGTIDVRAPGEDFSPSWALYRGAIWQYSFTTTPGATSVFVNFHVGHDFIPGSDVYIHSHWSTIAAPTGQVNWMFEAVAAVGYGADIFEGTDGLTGSVTMGAAQTSHGAYFHEIAETLLATDGGLVPVAVNVSIGSGSATLTAAAATWTAADIGKTVQVAGAGVAGAALRTTISGYTSTTQVTLALAASTAVTAQQAFYWRVLDSSHQLKPDSVILVRVWRDSARTADTLNVAPFLHFADCHYQTNGVMGTKTRNAPFYT